VRYYLNWGDAYRLRLWLASRNSEWMHGVSEAILVLYRKSWFWLIK
jgi:hypothetical protein